MERVIDQFTLPSGPREVMAAIDRMATKKGYSVYEDGDDELRVYGQYTRFRIKHDAGELEVRVDGSIPKMWFLIPVVILGTGIAFQDALALIPTGILLVLAIKWMKKLSARRAVIEASAFHEKLVSVVECQCGRIPHTHHPRWQQG